MYKNILIVDDDICLAHAIKLYLSSDERKIFIVDDANSALNLLGLYHFDLVISDIMMPKIGGYDFLIKLRLDPSFLNLPVIFLTAKGMTSDRIKGYDLGCNAYLTKPFHPSELLSIVNNILLNFNSRQYLSKFKFLESLELNSLLDNNKILCKFTSREISILKLLAKGMMNKEIALNLNLGIKNVEKYVSRLLSKTNTRNRTELAQLSWSFNLIKGE
uniref:TctD-like protein n=1 Tax=Synarthrophyton chejuense TaxID=2485825 RepID=A0A3G3MFS7_9FLOR|nr:hypothetical protein [Synarthrophyton chejuense]AYR05683.1 hypothetical protein [Synarthrophyton chejuense]